SQPYAPGTSDLTRVGSVLGTPLYMSPEQCRGDKLDPRSDIYSLGVIAYQMLSGETPFRGEFTQVMESHRLVPPPPLDAKKVRKKLKRVINSALAKEPEDRPQTAEAFASSLRSRSEGIFELLRRSGMIWTEHIQKYLTLSTLFFLPIIAMGAVIVTLSFLKASEVIPETAARYSMGITAVLNGIMTAFCTFLILGTIAWIVTQRLAIPLRPVKLRVALAEARKKWTTFAGLGIVCTLITVLAAGLAFAVVFGIFFAVFWLIFGISEPTVYTAAILGACAGVTAFFIVNVWLMLVAPVAMMENLRGRKAIKRSKALISRSLVTALAAYVIMFLIPAVAAGSLSFMLSMTAKALEIRRPAAEERKADNSPLEPPVRSNGEDKEVSIGFRLGQGRRASASEGSKDMRERLIDSVLETLLQILLLPIQIVVISFTAIIVALLYLKTRQAGGESLHELLANFEESDKPRKRWQERVRQRLIQSGRITGRT
ncbi:MAG TPA: protein kinase, partial [Pyrinomonadaceae bacterium]|nr:protein kinase [Pyrinomonadaceae bacterium]